jgi:hypothetical protein
VSASAIFAPLYAAVLVLFAVDYLRPSRVRMQRERTKESAAPYVAGLVLTYAAMLALMWYAAAVRSAPQLWRAELPFPVVTRDATGAQFVSLAMLLLAVVQCALLLAIYRRNAGRAAVVAGATIVLVLSLAVPAFVSLDAYSYVSDAALGLHAYDLHPAIDQQQRIVADAFGGSPPPAPYGPLWIGIAWIVTFAFPSLVAKLIALRVFGALSAVAFVAGLRALGMPSRILTVAALNPAIALQYVANAHNDLFCAAALVWAAVLVRRSPAAALLAVVAASLVKAPFAIFALPVFRRAGSIVARVAWASGAILTGAAVSYAIGGVPYVRAVAVHLPSARGVELLGTLVALAAIGVLAVALVRAGRRRNAVWLLPLAGSYPTPWYGIWGAGYASSSRRVMGYLLVVLPLAAMLTDTMFLQVWWLLAVVPLLVALEVLRKR